jgi:hypothetical protein
MNRFFRNPGVYLLPSVLILVFLCSFIHGALWYMPDGDDVYFLGVEKAMGPWKGSLFFYQQVTGRWLGHILSFLNFSIFGCQVHYYWIPVLLMLFVFLCSLAYLLRVLAGRYFGFKVSFFGALFSSLLFTSCLYFFLYEGRWETWYWLSSVFIHPFGLSLMFLGFGCILDENLKGPAAYILLGLAFFALGGIQEICSVLSFLFFAWIYKESNPAGRPALLRKMIPAAFALAVSFLVNLLSSGFRTRIDNQPSFRILQSLKNTIHSMLVPVLNYEYLIPRVLAFLIWIWWLRNIRSQINIPNQLSPGLVFKRSTLPAFGIIVLCLFMTCYVLCDIAPQRCLLFPAVTFMLFSTGLVLHYPAPPIPDKNS